MKFAIRLGTLGLLLALCILSSACTNTNASGWLDGKPSTDCAGLPPATTPRIAINDEQTTVSLKQYGPTLAHLPSDARKFRDIEFLKTPQGSVYLDIYLPAKTSATLSQLPLIVWIHGGGWHTGKGARDAFAPGRMVKRGYALASIDYRDSKDAKFPAQIHDCKAAIRWLRAHADEYGIDPKRIGVWGASAGGHLSALLCTSSNVKGLEGDGGNLEFSSRPQAALDYCGPTDFFQIEAPETSKSLPFVQQLMKDFVGGDLKAKRDLVVQANPITHADAGDPPLLIMTGDADPLIPVKQSELLYEALKAKGAVVTLAIVKNGSHLFYGPTVDREVDAFFDKYLDHTSQSGK